MTTEWRPDTCNCILQYDSGLKFIATQQACQKHASVAGSASHLVAVLAHNQARNAVLNALTAANPQAAITCTYDATAPSSNDPIITSGLTPAQTTLALTALSSIPVKVVSIGVGT